MTGPSNKKQVLTAEHLEVLEEHIAYSKTQADRAGAEADKIGQFVGDAQVVLGELADTKADIEQSQAANAAQQQANNAQVAAIGNKTPALTVASIPATVGLFYITGPAEAGQVWEKTTSGGAAVRRPELEAEPARAKTRRAPLSGADISVVFAAAVAAGQNALELEGYTYVASATMNLPNSFVISAASTSRRPTINLVGDLGARLFGSTSNTGGLICRSIILRNLYINLNKQVDYGLDVQNMVSCTIDNCQIFGARIDNIHSKVLGGGYSGYNDFRNVNVSAAGGVGIHFEGGTNQTTINQGSANGNDIGIKVTGGWNVTVMADVSGNRIGHVIGCDNYTTSGYQEFNQLDFHILPGAYRTTIQGYRYSINMPFGIVDEGEQTLVNGILWRSGGTAGNLLPNGAFRYGSRPDGLPNDIEWVIDGNSNSAAMTITPIPGGGFTMTSKTTFAGIRARLNRALEPYRGQWVTIGFQYTADPGNSLKGGAFSIRDNNAPLPADGLNMGYRGGTDLTPERHRSAAKQIAWGKFRVPDNFTDLLLYISVSGTPEGVGDKVSLHGLFLAPGKDVFPQIDSPPLMVLDSISAPPQRAGQRASVGEASYLSTATAWQRVDNAAVQLGTPGTSMYYRSGSSGTDAYCLIGNVGSEQRMVLRYQGGKYDNYGADLRNDVLELAVRNDTLQYTWATEGVGARTTAGLVAFKQPDGTHNVYSVTRGTAFVYALVTGYVFDRVLVKVTPLALSPSVSTTTPTGTLSLDTTAAGFGPTDAKIVSVGNGNYTPTLKPGGRTTRVRYTTPFTVNVALTLPVGYDGATVKLTRMATATGAFDLDFHGLKVLTPGTWAAATYDGTAWFLSAAGTL